MYEKGKYVTGEIITGKGIVDGAILISEVVPHDAIRHCFIPGTITGAGYFTQNAEGVQVFGESKSLGIGVSEADEIWVGRALAHPNYHR